MNKFIEIEGLIEGAKSIIDGNYIFTNNMEAQAYADAMEDLALECPICGKRFKMKDRTITQKGGVFKVEGEVPGAVKATLDCGIEVFLCVEHVFERIN